MNNVATMNENQQPKKKGLFEKLFSIPLLKQSIKSNWVLWTILSVGSALIFIIINLAIGTKKVFTNIDMGAASQYVIDEDMSWLQIFGLFDILGFRLERIQVMSQIDLNSVMNDLIYKIAGVLLPMIYVMIVGNKLLAYQVNDGSMAYVLSTPTNRKKVVRTQYFFLAISLVLMYVVITFGAYVSGVIGNAITHALPLSTFTLRTVLYCFGSFSAIFCLMGVCFGASAICNKSSKSIAIGGGACVLAFLCCILGLFGNKVFVAVGVGVKEMNFFNYLTVFTLIDTESMSNFAKGATKFADIAYNYDWLWKAAILLALGGALGYFGGRKFINKDLPL